MMAMSIDLKAPKPIEDKLKKEGEIVIMNKSLPFKDDEINYAISEITSNLSDIEKTEGYAVRKLGNDFIHLKYDKNGKHHLGKFGVDDSKYD
jgi:hypothetical protein